MQRDRDTDSDIRVGAGGHGAVQPLSKGDFTDVLQNSIVPVVYELLGIHSHVCLEA